MESSGFAVSPGVGRQRTFPQAGEHRQRLHRAARWPFPGCKALLAAVESFPYVFFCGFEWDRVLSCVWETQWVDRKTVHLTSGVCENLKEL